MSRRRCYFRKKVFSSKSSGVKITPQSRFKQKAMIQKKAKRDKRNFEIFVVLCVSVFCCLSYLFFADSPDDFEKGLLFLSQMVVFLNWWRFKYVRGEKWVRFSSYLLYFFNLSFYFGAASLIAIATESKYPNYFHYCLTFWFITLENEILRRSLTAFDLEKPTTPDEEVDKAAEQARKKQE